MNCPLCNSSIDYNEGYCEHCGKEFDMPEGEEFPWALIYTTSDLISAEMYKANLEGANIPAVILDQVDTTRMLNLGELAVVKIYVPSYLANTAKQIILDIENS